VLLRDPGPAYVALRQAPLARVDLHGGYVALTRYGDVAAAARAAEAFSSRSVSIPASGDRFIPITLDGSEHADARALLAPFFSPRPVEERSSQIQSTTDALLDRLAPRGEADISVDLTRVVPTVTLLQLIGVPAAHIDRVAGWTDTLIFDEHATAESGGAAARALQRYLYDLVVARSITAASSTDSTVSTDLIGSLVARAGGHREVDLDDAVNIVTTLLFGGLGPTTFLMNGALHRIAADPDLRRRLLADPELLTSATEEFLRLVSPVASIGRVVAGVDHPLSLGVDAGPGDQVLLVWAAANRDDDQFADAESFVADRHPNRHLAFGAGVHRCLGAHLARLQFRIVVGSVLRRLPDYAVSDPAAVGRLTGHMEGIHRLPIRFTPTGSPDRPI
jgi:cytochrome P450